MISAGARRSADAPAGFALLLQRDEDPHLLQRACSFHLTSQFDRAAEDEAMHTPIHRPTAPTSIAGSQQVVIEGADGTPLFLGRPEPLLPSPPSFPRPPTRRRKMLAPGALDLSTTRCSIRLKAKNRSTPIATMAEKILCMRLGIAHAGEDIMEQAIARFVELFRGQLPSIAIEALRALFHLDCDLTTAVEQALIAHGGPGGVDIEPLASATVVV
jgi:hypothetical protein